MPAALLMQRRVVLAPDAFAEVTIWRLPQPLPPAAHAFKHRLAYVVGGECVLRYDNERGKGDHRHVGTATTDGWTSFQSLDGRSRSSRILPHREDCGDVSDLTREHVIPRCLFIQPYPVNLITVPGCDDCNGRKSADDDFLRDFFAVDVHSSNSPVAKTLFAGTVQRSLSRNSSHLLRDMLPRLRCDDRPWAILRRQVKQVRGVIVKYRLAGGANGQ